MADRYCRNCGHELRETDRFCPNCASPVQEVAHVPTPEADVSVPPPSSAQRTGAPTQERTRRAGRFLVGGIAALLGLGILAVALAALGGSELVGRSAVEPTSEEVVQAFRDAGLEVKNAHPLEEDPEWGTGMVPKTEKEGTRFDIPSGGDTQGDVFTYESREDLEVMKNYWETFNESGSGMFYTHIYDKGNVLVRIDGSLPKGQADEYGQVLEKM